MPEPGHPKAQRGFYIAAPKKSSGKTVISLGLGAALTQSGRVVQAFKKGPDYIDPYWHQAATGRPCFNLDFYTQDHEEIRSMFERQRAGADVIYIEGNMGLFDGLDPHGSDCNAALADLLQLPVVLVVNARGVNRGIAPLLSGYEKFSETIEYAGVVLNETAGARHESKLLAAIAEYTDLTVLGTVPRLSQLHLDERHIGLVPQNEATDAGAYIDRAAELVRQHLDLDTLLQRSASLDPPATTVETNQSDVVPSGPRIGIARDAAFGFYYPDDLQALQDQGAALVYFDTLTDTGLPDVDALFIGGGFPETQLEALHANLSMREQIADFVRSGKPVYAECGGLMYLCKAITYQGRTEQMVGVIDAEALMMERPVGRGYARIKPRDGHPWNLGASRWQERRCHEFHHSKLVGPASESEMAYEVSRGYGVNGKYDGILLNNTLAAYCHQRHTRNNPWTTEFINFIQSIKHENN